MSTLVTPRIRKMGKSLAREAECENLSYSKVDVEKTVEIYLDEEANNKSQLPLRDDWAITKDTLSQSHEMMNKRKNLSGPYLECRKRKRKSKASLLDDETESLLTDRLRSLSWDSNGQVEQKAGIIPSAPKFVAKSTGGFQRNKTSRKIDQPSSGKRIYRDDEPLTLSNESPSLSNESPTGSNKSPTGSNKSPTGSDKSPTGNKKRSKINKSNESPTLSNESLTLSNESPTGSDKSSAGSEKRSKINKSDKSAMDSSKSVEMLVFAKKSPPISVKSPIRNEARTKCPESDNLAFTTPRRPGPASKTGKTPSPPLSNSTKKERSSGNIVGVRKYHYSPYTITGKVMPR